MKTLLIISIILQPLITHLVGAFTIHSFTTKSHSSPSKLYSSTPPSSLQELLSNSSKWTPIKQELDHVPIFTITNDQNQPLQYNVGGTKTFAFFFIDVDAVKNELTKAKGETNMESDTLQITPFPLGEIFELAAKEMAVIVPSVQGLEGAGAPKGLNPIGQQVPLFGCMDIQVNVGSGDGDSMMTSTPLFFTFEEAENAMNMALGEAGGSDGGKKFEVTVMPLVKAVQTMVMNENKSFLLEAPKSSLDYLRGSMK